MVRLLAGLAMLLLPGAALSARLHSASGDAPHATGFARDSAARRSLLQALSGVTEEMAVDLLSQMIGTFPARDSSRVFSTFAFAKLLNAFLVQEYITIVDTSASLNTFTDPSTNLTTITPGQIWYDAAVGAAFEAGVSALLYVNSVENLNGTIPAVGSQIPESNVQGKVNVPARRRLMAASQLQSAAEQGAVTPTDADVAAAAEAVNVTLPGRMMASVSPANMVALTAGGFWETLLNILPPGKSGNLTDLLQTNSVPLANFMLMHNVTQEDVDLAIAQLGGHDLTITQPTKPAIGSITVVPVLDIQFSFTLLDQANQAGANVRVTPWATRLQGNGQAFQSVKVVPFLAAFANLVPNGLNGLAADGQAALEAAAGLLQHNTSAAQAFIADKVDTVKTQLSPIPTILTAEFDIFIRAQIQFNGGDIGLVL